MYIAIGKITQPHGINGVVKAISYLGMPQRYDALKTIYIETARGMQGFILEDVQFLQKYALLKLKGINSRNDADKIAKKEVWVPESHKIQLEENEFFIHDLIGLKVFDIHRQYLGILENVMLNGGNDIYVVLDPDNDREILVPAVGDFIKSVDVQQGEMIVELIEGMLE